MLKYFCFLTGDDYQMLQNDTPASQKKVKLLALCLFIPTGLWLINGYLLAKSIMQCTIMVSITTAIICAFLIFSIERAIIMMRGSNWVIVIRVLMGLLVACLGSIAIDEVVFDRDITIQVAQKKPLMLEEDLNKINIENKENVDKQIQLVNTKYNIWQKAVNDAKQEADGSGGSGHRGVSAITKIKEVYATQAQEDYQNNKSSLDVLNNTIEDKNKQIQLDFNDNFNSHSILLRIQALFELVCENTWMKIIYIIFTLLMIFLEFMVIIIKLLSHETNYERKLDMIENIGKRKMEALLKNAAFDPLEFHPLIKQAKTSLNKTSSIF